MSTTTTQTRPTRGRGGHRNKSRANNKKSSEPAKEEAKDEPKDKLSSTADEDETAVCWICAEQVKYYSVSECNHRTCHVCALRLRALYKKTDCTFCKEPQPTVIFTLSAEEPYTKFDQETMQFKDTKLAIVFETQEMMEETLILLRFNCPDTDCDYIATGWNDLKLHVRAVHNKNLCDLCLRNKKVFSHEHTLYTFPQLVTHLPSIPHRANMKPISRDQIEGGIHPLCEFCNECFFSDDELYKHMRERHEECFVCKRNEIRDQYFADYNALEKHFHTAHHPCPQPSCLAQKFVVFGSTIDLQAHMVEEHGADMSTRDKKEARKVRAPFEFEDVGGRRGQHHQQQRPPLPPSQPPAPPPAANAGPSRTRRREFGSNLTAEDAGGVTPPLTRTPTPPAPSTGNGGSSSSGGTHSPTTLSRHNHFLTRLSTHLLNPTTGIPAIKAAIRSYRSAESTSRDLILTIFESTGRNLEGTASVVNGFVDLLDPDEEEERRVEVLASWKGFEVEQRRERQFPELSTLSALSLGSGGGWGPGAGGRVLNAKKSTRNQSSRNQSSRMVWDRVARAAGSGSGPSVGPSSSTASSSVPDKFPSLPLKPTKSLPQSTTPYKQPQRSTPWAPPPPPASSSSAPHSVPGTGSSSGKPPPPLSSTLFPSLPSSTKGKDKPVISGTSSLKNITGNRKDVGNVWGSTPAPGSANEETPGSTGEGNENNTNGGGGGGGGPGGKGKKKGKQKQTLFSTFTPVG